MLKLLSLLNTGWAITPEKFDELRSFYEAHLAGEKADINGLKSELEARGLADLGARDSFEIIDGVAVLPLSGVLSRELSFFSFIFGGTSTIAFGEAFQAAMEHEEVSAILIDVDSPGGAVAGTEDLGEMIFSARGTKPVVAFTDGMMASGALWIGSSADQVVISGDTALVGSIGVVATHIDQSRRLKAAGIDATEIVSSQSPMKRVASNLAPLTDAGRRNLQTMVDSLAAAFVSTVARNRGVSEERLLESSAADGSLFVGRKAIEVGLVDGVSTRQALIASLASGGGTGLGGGPGRARRSQPTAAAAGAPGATDDPGGTDMDLKKLTAEELAAERPDLVKAITSGAEAVARESAATSERERILGIEEQALPGHEKLVAELKADGKTTPEQAAVRILKAEKEKGSKYVADAIADAPNPSPSGEEPRGSSKDIDPNLPLADRCKAAWERDPALRSEFMDDFEAFHAFAKAKERGSVKRLKDREAA